MSLFPRARPKKAPKKTAKATKLPPALGRVHVFVGDGKTVDWYGNPICADCGQVRRARVHAVPELDDDAAELKSRIVGEDRST